MRRGVRTIRQALSGLLSLYAHDPAQAGLLAGLAVAGLIVIGLWGLYGDLVLSNLVVVASSEVLIAVYALVIAVRMENLVRSHDRWQVESALTFRQLLAEAKSFGGDAQAGSPFYAQQLRRQLDEEIRSCREFGSSFSLVVLRLELPGQSPSHAIFAQANAEVADLMLRHRDAFVCPTALGMFEYAFFLRNSDRATARTITAYLARSLKKYRCFFGVVVFPEDGTEADLLIRRAVEQCGMLQGTAA